MTLVINHKTNKMSDQESSEFSWSQAGNSSSKIIRDLKYGSWNKYTFPIFHRKLYHGNYTLKTLLWTTCYRHEVPDSVFGVVDQLSVVKSEFIFIYVMVSLVSPILGGN